MSHSPVRPRRDCPSFRPGHQTHWIQAKPSWSRYADQRWPGDAIVRCPAESDVGALTLEEHTEQLGGFSVPGREVSGGA